MVGSMQKKWNLFDIVNYTLLSLVGILTLLPFWHVLAVSLSSYENFVSSKFLLIPDFNFSAYYIVGTGKIYKSFLLTVFIVIVSTLLHLVITTVSAYPLSRKYLRGRTYMLVFILITMLFGGGLIPYYLLIRELGFMNNIMVYLIPGIFAGFNTILMKNFFMQIPDSLEEAAKIDGAGDLYILYRLFIPLSMPIISTIALFYGVGKWNDWFTAVLFVDNSALYPIQNILRAMVIEGKMDTLGSGIFKNEEFKLAISVKMAVIVAATLPIVFVYPFLQRHFVKGVLLGSIKS